MASAQTTPLKRGVEVSNKLDPDATLVRVVYTHRPGLHCDLCACVDAQRLTIVRSDLKRAGHLRVHRFWVVDGHAGTKLEHAALTPLSLAVRDAVVDPGLWAKWHGVEKARRRLANDAAGETSAAGAGNGVGARARASVPATAGALLQVLLKLLANEVDPDELDVRLVTDTRNDGNGGGLNSSAGVSSARAGVSRYAFFDTEASLRVDEGADAAAAARAFAAGTGVAPPALVAIAENRSTPSSGGALTTSPERDDRRGSGETEKPDGFDRDGFPGTFRSPSPYAASGQGGTVSRGGAMHRAESIADLNRFQTANIARHQNPASPAPAPASPSPLSPAPYAPRHALHDGMPRSASVAEMRSPAKLGDLERGALLGPAGGPEGLAPSFETNALHRPRAHISASPHLKRAGHAIPHASSIADLQAMQAAQGLRGDIRGLSSPKSAFLAKPESDGSPSGSRSPSRLGLQIADRGEDVEMADLDEPNSSFSHARDPRVTPDDGYSLDGTSVALVSETLNVARKSLFGEGRFPTLPAPRRDADASQYRLLRELGRGLCGTVYLAEEKLTGRIVAFKVMRKTKLVDVGEATHASEERRLHERVSSGPFINRLLASFQDPWALFLVLEYAPCGDLFQAMNFHGLPSRFDATVYAAQVAIALSHLHALGYVYRDLKPENILLHPHGSAQLADFGMAKRLTFSDGSSSVYRRARGNLDANTYDAFQKRSDTSDTSDARTYTICGTAQYMSPEVLLHRGCRFEADLWALGIFVYELVTGDTPFSVASGSRQELYRKLMSHDPESMEMPASVDEKTASLVRALLKNDERNRLGAGGNWDALFTHRWFGGLDVDAVRGGAIVPKLSPRRRNVITDPALRKVLDRGDAPWRRGAIIEDAKTRALFDRF